MTLKQYHRKRDFSLTPEPKGREKQQTGGRQFVIQKHAASRLHYDFRLELDGVLLSWAVPKGPSLDPADKCLAVHVEDHPVDYATFEGVIPQGQYGGGTVMLWDRGTWEPKEDPRTMYRRGKLEFELFGEKLKGKWILIRMHPREGEKADNWLLRKVDDKAARPVEKYDVREKKAKSVATGRTLDQIAKDADRVWSSTKGEVKVKKKAAGKVAAKKPAAKPRARRKRAKSKISLKNVAGAKPGLPPAKFYPQLATLVRDVPNGENWIHEIKFDGYRLLAKTVDRNVQLITRRGNDWTDRFPTVATEVKELQLNGSMLDGEVIIIKKDGTPDFQALQNLMQRGSDADVVYYAFDLPFYNGYDLTAVPLIERKRILAEILQGQPSNAVVRYSDHIAGDGKQVVAHACRHALEGIVSKQADSQYVQKRSRSWLKIKCTQRQEFVIAGWSDPGGSRSDFGSLLLGHYEGDRLVYSGRVGTGFTAQSLQDVKRALDRIETKTRPFASLPKGTSTRDAHWVKPELVAEIEFSNWTDEGLLRHPSFQGLREDKEATEVTREKPADRNGDRNGDHQTNGHKNGHKKVASVKRVTKKEVPAGRSRGASPEKQDEPHVIAGVRLSNPDRILFPEQALTKLDLAEYYAEVGDWILPHVVDRPLTLVRCPRGRAHQCFYQKHVTESIPDIIQPIEIAEKEGTGLYVSINDLQGLIALVQLGVLEFHPWGSREDNVDRPDRIVLDLDPGPEVAWRAVVDGAKELRERLQRLGLTSFLRTTGGKGLHVVVPIARRVTWDELKAFARSIADAMVRDNPGKYIATMSKARRVGKIYVDYLRNDHGATAIASYSTRARLGATVSTPLRWDELSTKLNPTHFNTHSVPKRLATLHEDPWEGFFEMKQSLTRTMMQSVAK